MEPPKTTGDVTPPASPLAMTDEEGDIEVFQGYLATLPPESLWDISAHLDPDRYPRRCEAVQREIARRGLFFVAPYTRAELGLRAIVGGCLTVAALAAVVHLLPSGALLISRLAQSLGAHTTDAAGEPVGVSFIFTDRELALLAALLCWLRPAALGSATLALGVALQGGIRFAHRRLRADLMIMVALGALLTLTLTWLAF